MLSRASPREHRRALLLEMSVMDPLVNDEGRTAPALVHPAPPDAGGWVVEPPADQRAGVSDEKTFVGPRALERALRFAHEAYGSVQVLSC